jgi:S1-C subfamily serine protease
VSSGAGVVIHPNGFILTADHVTRDLEGVAIFGLMREPYRIVSRLPEKDLAVLKVAAPKARDFVPLGRSRDVMEGETVLAIGNPGGRGIVYSQGIVSCASMDPSWPSVLSQTFWRDTFDQGVGRDDFIQFDAASNPGNSGGPLINAAGELIGVVSAKRNGEEAINWAIPVDRARRFFNYLVQPEEADGTWAGLEVDLIAPRATVVAVAENSPAAKVGLAPSDVLLALDNISIRNGPDYLLALSGHKVGASLPVTFEHGGKARTSSLTLDPYPLAEPVSKKGKSPGLRFKLYRPEGDTQLHKMPECTGRQPAQEGVIARLTPDEFVKGSKDNYAVVFEGYLEFPKAGHYRVVLTSDDGSRFYLNKRLVVDNDYGHPPLPLSRSVRVPAGLVPIQIDYFNGRGGRELTLEIKAMDEPGQPVSEGRVYRD